MSTELHEECGVFGIYSPVQTDAASAVWLGLFALQHRGQESCGIVVNDGGVFRSHKDVGLVSEVFPKARLDRLGRGQIAVGHVRYGTTGASSRMNCQPVEVHHMTGALALAHNGNLTNSAALRRRLEMSGAIFHMTSDTETIAYTITGERLGHPTLEDAVLAAMDVIDGAYSLVMMDKERMVAARDPHGFRPLCYGRRPDGAYIVASESCALSAAGAEMLRDVLPGEILVFDQTGVRSVKTRCQSAPKTLCVFEYIYFARPDSVIDGMPVSEARLRAGRFLAQEHPVGADVVIGVPDSGLEAALGYSQASGIPYETGFVKNKYIGRTFISPGQSSREDKVRIKLNPIGSVVRGKRVVMIDDSIVRGTTCGRIVRLLREAGAAEVHVRISSPPFLHPCFYGTDVDSGDHLVARSHTVGEIAAIIGADSLGYLSLENAARLGCDRTYCTACFSGAYPTDIPEAISKDCLEEGATTLD